jgi:hypothetical protein
MPVVARRLGSSSSIIKIAFPNLKKGSQRLPLYADPPYTQLPSGVHRPSPLAMLASRGRPQGHAKGRHDRALKTPVSAKAGLAGVLREGVGVPGAGSRRLSALNSRVPRILPIQLFIQTLPRSALGDNHTQRRLTGSVRVAPAPSQVSWSANKVFNSALLHLMAHVDVTVLRVQRTQSLCGPCLRAHA